MSNREYNNVREEICKSRTNPYGDWLQEGHALLRALRRGFAVYIEDGTFPTYHRVVQRLAQTGKLALVFSDYSLAYGVNMPFRTCCFCGDTPDLLDALNAQQMAGRAGRRGLDFQGNLVYVGMDWERIQDLMIGQIPAIEGKSPLYPTMSVQEALTPFVDRDAVVRMSGKTFKQFRHDQAGTSNADDPVEGGAEYLVSIEQACQQLGFLGPRFPESKEERDLAWEKLQELLPVEQIAMLEPDTFWMNECEITLETEEEDVTPSHYQQYGTAIKARLAELEQDSAEAVVAIRTFFASSFGLKLAIDWPFAAMVWELREYMSESLVVGFTFNDLLEAFVLRESLLGENANLHQKATVEKVERHHKNEGVQLELLAIVCQICDRHECPEGSTPLHETPYFIKKPSLWTEWQARIQASQDRLAGLPCEEELRLEVPVGTSLDSGVFEVLRERNFPADMTSLRKHDLCQRLWRLGNILKQMGNCCSQGELHESIGLGRPWQLLAPLFRRCFNYIKYSRADLAKQESLTVDATVVSEFVEGESEGEAKADGSVFDFGDVEAAMP
jgi:hypothetical protein